MALKYALRVDVLDADVKDGLCKFLDEMCEGYIASFEEPRDENPHVHVVFDSRSKIKVLRNALTRTYLPQCVGNKHYSMKVCDDDWDAYMRYICKGTKEEPPVIWYHHGLLYTADAVNDAWRRYWVNNAAIAGNAAKRAKVEAGNVVEQVERLCKAQGIKAYDRAAVARVYCHLYRDARKGINVFSARSCVNTVCLLLEGGGDAASETMLVNKIADI